MTDRNNQAELDELDELARTQTIEVQPKPKGGFLSTFFGSSSHDSKRNIEGQDMISIEEGDDGSVEAGFDNWRKDNKPPEEATNEYEDEAEERQAKPRGSGFFSMFSSRKLTQKGEEEEDHAVEQEDNDPAEAERERERQKYDVNALRIPAVLDQDLDHYTGNVVQEDEEEILKDPYSEIPPMKEPMMMDEEEVDEENEISLEKKRFMMSLTSKFFFLLGSMIFVMLATHDYQRIKRSQPQTAPREQTNPQDSSDPTGASNNVSAVANIMDDDVDPFLDNSPSATGGLDLEEELAMEEAQKEERAGSLYNSGTEGTRRRRAATNWYTEYWVNLPEEVQEAAKLLGYEQSTWDAAESVYTDRLHWDQLTPDQQDAAQLVFGYDEDTWDDYVDRFLDNLVNNSDSPESTDDTPEPSPTPTAKLTARPTARPTETPQTSITPVPPPDEISGGGSGEITDGNEDTETSQGEDNQSNEVDEVDPGTTDEYPEEAEELEGDTDTTAEYPEVDGSENNGEDMNGTGEDAQEIQETETGQESNATDAGDTGDETDQVGNSTVSQAGDRNEATGDKASVSAVNEGYNVNTVGEQPRGTTFQVFYLLAAVCFVVVGLLDALQQQLGFHAVMVLAGVSGVMAGAFSVKIDMAFNICHSISCHLFLLQAVLVIYSRLLLTYDNSVRRILNLADGFFLAGGLMNVFISYMQYRSETTPGMTKASLSAFVFWCVAGLIYVAMTVMLWLERKKSWQSGATSPAESVQDSCNVVENSRAEGCEISLTGDEARGRASS